MWTTVEKRKTFTGRNKYRVEPAFYTSIKNGFGIILGIVLATKVLMLPLWWLEDLAPTVYQFLSNIMMWIIIILLIIVWIAGWVNEIKREMDKM